MKLTEELHGELTRLAEGERLIIQLPDRGDRDEDWPREFAREVAQLVGFDRVLVFVGIDGARATGAATVCRNCAEPLVEIDQDDWTDGLRIWAAEAGTWACTATSAGPELHLHVPYTMPDET